jgi:hypothetical protein
MHVQCVADNLFKTMSATDMRLRRDLRSNIRYRKEYKKAYAEKVKKEVQEETERILAIRKAKKNHFRRINGNLVTSESQILGNIETNDSVDVSGHGNSILPTESGTIHRLRLDDFFKRPVLIDDFTLNVNDFTDQLIKPFELWSDDATVRSKLSHYTYFKGTLCVRVTLSATKFHFGTLMLSFQPYAESNLVLTALLDNYLAELNPGSLAVLNNYLSQSPERHIIKIGTDNSVELRLPMICPKQAVKLFNKDGSLITNSTSFEEMGPLGDLVYSSLNALRVANDDKQSNVKVQTFAWMEDVELGPTTATDMNITAEAAPVDDVVAEGLVKGVTFRDQVNNNPTLQKIGAVAEDYASDEYMDAGPISKIASAVSNIAEKASDIPMIGLAAKATSWASGAAAKAFKFFGFSKPVQLEPLIFVKNLPYSNGAVLENKDTAYKLTADPKQELSIQPFGGEVPIDPMAIKFLTGRESYFHTFQWSETDTPRTDTLAVFPVMPMIDTQFVTELDDRIHQTTALGFASIPFNHWRGTISFRFEVVASAYHRGKLMFIYEPNLHGLSLIESNVSDLNQQYIYYLDIEEGRDLTIDCGFVYDRLFANVYEQHSSGLFPTSNAFRNHSYSSSDLSVYVEYANNFQSIGSVYVRPFTSLTSPSTNADDIVSINCYVYSDDMEFCVPIDLHNTGMNMQISAESQPKDGMVERAKQVTIGSNTRTSDTYVLINKEKPKNDNIYLYHFGEKIESFRSLLKRDEGVGIISTAAGSTNGISTISIPIYPAPDNIGIPTYGLPVLNSETELSTSTAADNGQMCLFNILRYAYLFCKGGYRYRVYQSNPLQYFGSVCVDRVVFNGDDDQYLYLNDQSSTGADRRLLPKMSGSAIFNTNTNDGVEFEIPYYSDNLFELCGLPYVETTDTHGGMFSNGLPGANVTFERSTTSHSYITRIVGSAAEDFTFFRFQGGTFFQSA